MKSPSIAARDYSQALIASANATAQFCTSHSGCLMVSAVHPRAFFSRSRHSVVLEPHCFSSFFHFAAKFASFNGSLVQSETFSVALINRSQAGPFCFMYGLLPGSSRQRQTSNEAGEPCSTATLTSGGSSEQAIKRPMMIPKFKILFTDSSLIQKIEWYVE